MADMGRQVKYGVGKETTPGTAAAATYWLNQLSFDLKPRTGYLTNTSAFGVLEKSNSAMINRKWAEGSLEHKLTSGISGLIFLGAMGSVSTADNADTDATVKDHTFTLTQNVAGQTLTFIRKDSLSTEAYALGRIGQWELNMALDDYVTFSADILAKTGAATTASPAFTDEKSLEFVAKHFSAKTATSVAGLAGATAISSVESCTLTVNPNIEADWQAGSEEPYAHTSRGYDITFEMSARYNDRTYENAYKNGTALALGLTLKNTDTTIGTSANPTITFTMPRVYIDDWDRDEGSLDSPVMQTIKGTAHFSPADAYALQSVWTNTVASY